jgi:acyl-CoA synthetase (NDP forming)
MKDEKAFVTTDQLEAIFNNRQPPVPEGVSIVNRQLDSLFHPRSVAVIGASSELSATSAVKMGTAALQYLVEHRFPGKIYPVNPSRQEVMGLPCYARVQDIPGAVDLAVLVLPAEACPQAMEDCVAKGVRAAIVLSSGFAEAGEVVLQERLVEIARRGGIRFCGPNTAGLVEVHEKLTASISMVCALNPFLEGEIAFITQSGALGGSMLSRAMEQGIGFSHWISTGNEADLDTADYLDYLIEQDSVKVFALFLEGVRNSQKFLEACRKAAMARKPIIVYKTGRSAVGAAAAQSHTGALAGSDRVFDAICKQYGLIRVDDVADLFAVALTFNWIGSKLPKGSRMGIVSASGGICGVGADECFRAGLEVPELSEAAKAELHRFVPAFASVRNPVDVTGQIRASTTGYQDTVRTILGQDYIDGLLLLVTMAAEPRASFYGVEISKLAQEAEKPVLVAWTGALSLAEKGYPMLSQNHVPNFLTVRQAVTAMRALVDYSAFLDRFEKAQPGKEAQ